MNNFMQGNGQKWQEGGNAENEKKQEAEVNSGKIYLRNPHFGFFILMFPVLIRGLKV